MARARLHLLAAMLLACNPLDSVPIYPSEYCAEPREIVVGCVHDGDTIYADSCDGESIRLLGISAPEVPPTVPTAECYGEESTDALANLVLGKRVTLSFDLQCYDAYKRTLAYVTLTVEDGDEEDAQDQVFVNQRSVQEGWSRVYEDFDNILLADLLYAAEADAQAANAGLWGACP